MCGTLDSLNLFARAYDYMLVQWHGMIQLYAFQSSRQHEYFYKVTELVFCTWGVEV